MYSDGGGGRTITACSQARPFGDGRDYWDSGVEVTAQLITQLPRRFGYELTTVHTAEMLGMITGLGWRRRGQWNLLVCDRSALFGAMHRGREQSINKRMQTVCAPLETRLTAMLQDLEGAWNDPPKPQ